MENKIFRRKKSKQSKGQISGRVIYVYIEIICWKERQELKRLRNMEELITRSSSDCNNEGNEQYNLMTIE